METAVYVDNASLKSRVLSALQLMNSWRSLLSRGDVHSLLDDDAFDTGVVLAETLQASLGLVDGRMYPPALALVRTALESCLGAGLSLRFDELVVFARLDSRAAALTWLEVEFPAARDAGSIRQASLHGCNKPGCLMLVRPALITDQEGTKSRLPGARLLSIEAAYPAPVNRSRPLHRTRWFPFEGDEEHDQRTKWFYSHHLTWSTIASQLQSLGVLDELGVERLESHFDYLSLFVHPQMNTHKILRPRDWAVSRGSDPFIDRLVYLYCNWIADFHIASLLAYTRLRGELDFPDLEAWNRDESNGCCARGIGIELAGPGAPPHPFDIYRERTYFAYQAKHVDAGEEGPGHMRSDSRPLIDSDPLARIRSLAKPQRDLLTGEAYLPPKPVHLGFWDM